MHYGKKIEGKKIGKAKIIFALPHFGINAFGTGGKKELLVKWA